MAINFKLKLILFIITLFLIATIVSAALSKDPDKTTGLFIADYIDDEKGLQLYGETEDGDLVKTKKLNIADFYRDILKVQGNTDIIMECRNIGEFKECLNEHYESDKDLQASYESQMRQIQTAVDVGKEYGIDYMGSPFVRDLMEG